MQELKNSPTEAEATAQASAPLESAEPKQSSPATSLAGSNASDEDGIRVFASPPCQAYAAAGALEPSAPVEDNMSHAASFHVSPPCQGFTLAKFVEPVNETATAPEPSAPAEDEKSHATTLSEPVCVETVEDEEAPDETPFMVRMPSTDGSFASEVSGIKSQASDPTTKGSRESSFSSDAAGNGEIADMLGETLDKCAEAIDAMVSELDRTSLDAASAASAGSSYVGVRDEAEENVAEEEDSIPEETEAADGATILESVEADRNEADDVAEERSEDEWQVVTEKHQINSDEDLARAAQMIGSALFNSDMRSSGEMMSTLTGSAVESDGLSNASSALTSAPTVTTQITSDQRQRWGHQLTQLRTLGIDDEARCVEILERLTAANIGVGNDDEEVSVTAVVNALWK